MALERKEVLKSFTFEQQRREINKIGQDVYDLVNGDEGFESLRLDGELLDNTQSSGISGEFLASTGDGGVLWKSLSISNVLWVTKDGDDDNDGLSQNTAKATIGAALRAANSGDLGKLQDASNQILINKKLIQEETAGWLLSEYPFFTFPNSPPESGRYKDARNLIFKNIDEICDKALAEIAIQYDESLWGNDWTFPVIPLAPESNRFKDSYDLIQANKEEIQDKAFAELSVQYNSYPTDWVVPGFANPGRGRFYDSYRLIQLNRSNIIDTAYTASGGSIPEDVNGVKCKRDIGYFIDAISLDVFLGSTIYASKFTEQYFTGGVLNSALSGEVSQSVLAFESARDEMIEAMRNLGVITDPSVTPDPGSPDCADVASDITILANIVISNLNSGTLNLDPIVDRDTEISTSKCWRDLGYFVDAISNDVSYESNRYSINFVKFYFDNAGVPLTNGLTGETAQSIDAFEKARDLMKLAITNQLYEKDLTLTVDPSTNSNTSLNSCANVQTFINNLTSIITTVISDGDLDSLPVLNNGTYQGEESQRFKDAYRLIQKNKQEIVDQALVALATEYPTFVNPNSAKCERDLGYYIDAISLDVYFQGNRYSRKFASFYYDGNTLNYLDGELTESIFTFGAAKDLMLAAITNTLSGALYTDLTITADPETGSNIDSASCANVQLTINNLHDLVVDVLTNGDSTLNDYPENPGEVFAKELTCYRDISYIVKSVANDLYVGGNTNTFRAIRHYFDSNGNFIFINNESIQSKIAFEKAGDMMKKAITNQLYEKLAVQFGPSARVIGSVVDVNVDPPNDPQQILDEEFPNKIVGNGVIDTATGDLWVYDGLVWNNLGDSSNIEYGTSGNQNTCIDVQLTIETLISLIIDTIDQESLDYINNIPENLGDWAQYENICFRDIGYIIDAIASDLKQGGNVNCVEAGKAYYNGTNLVFIDGEKPQTLAAFNKAKQLMIYAMKNWRVDATGNIYKPTYSFIEPYIDDSIITDVNLQNLCSDVESSIENYFNIIQFIINNGPNSVEIQQPSFKTTIFVKSGVYYEDNPITLPPNTGIVGDNLREVTILPNNPTLDVFYLNNGSYLTGATFSGHLYPSSLGSFPKVKTEDSLFLIGYGKKQEYHVEVDNPALIEIGMTVSGQGIGTGAIVTKIKDQKAYLSVANTENFLTGRTVTFEKYIGTTGVITRSPYIQNCTSITTTGSGLRVDGNLAAGTASFVLDSYTQYNQGGDGIIIVNQGYTQLVSIFEICCDRAVYLSGGSTCSITNSNTDFGNYGLVADGTSPLQYVGQIDGLQAPGSIFNMKGLRTKPYVGQVCTFGNNGNPYYFVREINITNGGQGYDPLDPPEVQIDLPTGPLGIPAQAVANIDENGVITSVTLVSPGSQFITKPNVNIVGGTFTEQATATSEIYPQYYSVLTSTDLNEYGEATVTFDEVIPFPLNDDINVYFYQVTKIIANSHCFEYVGSGTQINKSIPAKGGVPSQEREIVELNGGKIAFTSTDHLGNFRIGGGIQINQNTGTLSGESFERSLFTTVTPFILALS